MRNVYNQVSDERYNIITERYENFQKALDSTDMEPVKVFDPLAKKLTDELELIREVSQFLQKKKDEDLSKAEQAAKKAEADAKKKAEEDAAKEAQKEIDLGTYKMLKK